MTININHATLKNPELFTFGFNQEIKYIGSKANDIYIFSPNQNQQVTLTDQSGDDIILFAEGLKIKSIQFNSTKNQLKILTDSTTFYINQANSHVYTSNYYKITDFVNVIKNGIKESSDNIYQFPSEIFDISITKNNTSINPKLVGTDSADTFTLGTNYNVSLTSSKGNDQYFITNQQIGNVNISDTLGTNIIHFDKNINFTKSSYDKTTKILTINNSNGSVITIKSADTQNFTLGESKTIIKNINTFNTNIKKLITISNPVDTTTPSNPTTNNPDSSTSSSQNTNSNNSNTNETTSDLNGRSIDGIIAKALVFIDSNNNNLYDRGEYSTKSDDQGYFQFKNIPTLATKGNIVSVGGVDLSTGLPNNQIMKAPYGSTVITPLTTAIVAIATSQNKTVAEAETILKQKLNLSADAQNVNLTQYDPLQKAFENTTLSNNSKASTKVAVELQNISLQIANTIQNVTTMIQSSDVNHQYSANNVINSVLNQLGTTISTSKSTTNLFADSSFTQNFINNAISDNSLILSSKSKNIVKTNINDFTNSIIKLNSTINDQTTNFNNQLNSLNSIEQLNDSIVKTLSNTAKLQSVSQNSLSKSIYDAITKQAININGNAFIKTNLTPYLTDTKLNQIIQTAVIRGELIQGQPVTPSSDFGGNGTPTQTTLKPNLPDLNTQFDSGILDNDNITNISDVVLSGTVNALNPNNSFKVEIFDNDISLGSANISGLNWSSELLKLSEGVHNLTIKATENNKLQSINSPILKVVVDKTIPTISTNFLSFADNISVINSTIKQNPVKINVNLVGTNIVEGDKIQLFINNNTNLPVVNYSVQAQDVNKKITINIPSSAYWGSDGDKLISAIVTDIAGNSNKFNGIGVKLDTSTASGLSLNIPTPNDAFINSIEKSQNLSLELKFNNVNLIPVNTKIELLLNDQIINNFSYNISQNDLSNGKSLLVIPNNLMSWGSDGSKVFKAKLTSPNGNLSNELPTVGFTLDTIAPIVSNISKSGSSSTINSSELSNGFNLNITLPNDVQNGDKIQIFSDKNSSTLIVNRSLTSTEIASHNVSYNVTSNDISSNSIKTFTTKLIDSAGNIGDAKIASFSFENTNVVTPTGSSQTPTSPVLASGEDTGLSSSDNIINKKQFVVFSGVYPTANSIIEIIDSTTTTSLGTTSVTSSGTWSITESAVLLPDGTHNIVVKATEPNKLQSSASNGLSITVDSVAPNAPTIIKSDNTTLTNSDISAGFSTKITLPTGIVAGDRLELYSDKNSSTILQSKIINSTDISTGYITQSISANAITQILSVKIQDIAGNLSTVATLTAGATNPSVNVINLNGGSLSDPTIVSGVTGKVDEFRVHFNSNSNGDSTLGDFLTQRESYRITNFGTEDILHFYDDATGTKITNISQLEQFSSVANDLANVSFSFAGSLSAGLIIELTGVATGQYFGTLAGFESAIGSSTTNLQIN